MNLITDTKILGKAIDSIAARGAKLDKDIQVAGCSCLARLRDFGDTGYINRLYLALGKGARKSALTSWLLAYGALVANTDKDSKNEKPFLFAKDKETNVEGAMADPWYDHKPEPAPDQVFDLQAAIKALINKASKASQLEHGEHLSALRALIGEDVAAGNDDTVDVSNIEEAPF